MEPSNEIISKITTPNKLIEELLEKFEAKREVIELKNVIALEVIIASYYSIPN